LTARYKALVVGEPLDRAYRKLLQALLEAGKCRNCPGSAADILNQMMSEGKIDLEKARTDMLASDNSAVQGALFSALTRHKLNNDSLLPGLAFDLEQVYRRTSDNDLRARILMNIPGIDQESGGSVTLSLGTDVLDAYPSQSGYRCRTVAHGFAYLAWKQPARIPELRSILLKFILREDVPKDAWFPAAEALWSFDPSAITESRNERDGRLQAAEAFFQQYGAPNIIRPPKPR